MALTRTVTVQQEVTGPIADLVYFVRKLEATGKITFLQPMTDEQLLKAADAFYDQQHGED